MLTNRKIVWMRDLEKHQDKRREQPQQLQQPLKWRSQAVYILCVCVFFILAVYIPAIYSFIK